MEELVAGKSQDHICFFWQIVLLAMWDKVKMVPGLVFTIEPMINTGRPECKIDPDGWTARTVDGGLSAQWEHTLGITEDGAIIFTEKMV